MKGDLLLRGSADPELKPEDLQAWAHKLKAGGLTSVEGDLVLDEGPNSYPPYGTGWAWDDAGNEYSPEITGLAVAQGILSLPPDSQASWLVRVAGSESVCYLIPGRAGVQVQGHLPDKIAPPNSALRTGDMLVQALQRESIAVRGKVCAGAPQAASAPPDTLVVHQSRPLSQLLKEALKTSDNFAMELFYRSINGKRHSALADQKLRIVDGSGLSRYNLISARQLTGLLLEEPGLKPLLPKGGEGTLKTRFLEEPTASQLVAKTGSLGNVSALAGYLFAGTDQECVFAILINGHLGTSAERKALEDGLVSEWVERFWPRQEAR